MMGEILRSRSIRFQNIRVLRTSASAFWKLLGFLWKIEKADIRGDTSGCTTCGLFFANTTKRNCWHGVATSPPALWWYCCCCREYWRSKRLRLMVDWRFQTRKIQWARWFWSIDIHVGYRSMYSCWIFIHTRVGYMCSGFTVSLFMLFGLVGITDFSCLWAVRLRVNMRTGTVLIINR